MSLTPYRTYVFTVHDDQLAARCARDVDGKPCRWRGTWSAAHGVPAGDVLGEMREHSHDHHLESARDPGHQGLISA